MRPVEETGVNQTLAWLEDEWRQVKTHLAGLDQQGNRAQGVVDDMVARLHGVEELFNAVRAEVQRIPALEEGLRQARDQASRLEARQADQDLRYERLQRVLETETQNLQQVVAEVRQRWETFRPDFETAVAKMGALEEMERRRLEPLTGLTQRQEELTRDVENLDASVRLASEQARRAEESLEGVWTELENMRSQDEVALSRVQMSLALSRQVEERVEEVLREADFRRSLAERIEVQRVEQHRIMGQLAELEQRLDRQIERLEEQTSQVRDTSLKTREAFDKILEIRQQIWEQQDQLRDQVAALVQWEEQVRRKGIGDLEGQIRDLRAKVPRGQQ